MIEWMPCTLFCDMTHTFKKYAYYVLKMWINVLASPWQPHLCFGAALTLLMRFSVSDIFIDDSSVNFCAADKRIVLAISGQDVWEWSIWGWVLVEPQPGSLCVGGGGVKGWVWPVPAGRGPDLVTAVNFDLVRGAATLATVCGALRWLGGWRRGQG